jgi:hypothetical protein
MIQSLYENYTAKIDINGELSRDIKINSGVRQGCILSPLLFLFVIDYIMGKVDDNKTGIPWTFGKNLQDLEFADDICLIEENATNMKKKILKQIKEAELAGIKINIKKCKIIQVNVNSNLNSEITIENEKIEDTENFCYLGSIIDKRGCKEDIQQRIGKAQNAYNSFRKIWQSSEITIHTKIRIFNRSVKSILLYGSESWGMTSLDVKKIQIFINKCLRRILGIYWPEKISNEELWKKCNQEPAETTIKRRKWKWIGHTLRKDNNDITKQALEYNIKGRRRKGRPTTTWKKQIHKEYHGLGKNWSDIKAIAKNKNEWKKTVEEILETPQCKAGDLVTY